MFKVSLYSTITTVWESCAVSTQIYFLEAETLVPPNYCSCKKKVSVNTSLPRNFNPDFAIESQDILLVLVLWVFTRNLRLTRRLSDDSL